LKKYIILLCTLAPLLLQAQSFKSYGLTTSFTLAASGWENPDTLGNYYHNKAYINTFTLGTYGEFLNKKYYSTMIDVLFKWRRYYFQYDLTPSPSQARMINNDMYFLSLAVYEKIKYDNGRWSAYVFGGIRANIRYKNSIEYDIQRIFENSNASSAALTAGIGFRKRIEKFFSISADIYYDMDFSKMYESAGGYVRNSEIGIRIGFGPFNPANK